MFTCCAKIHELALEVNSILRTTVYKSISNTKRLNQVKKHACFQSVCEPTNKHFTSGNHISHSALVSTTTTSSSQTQFHHCKQHSAYCVECTSFVTNGLMWQHYALGPLTFPSLPRTKLVTMLLKTTTKS